MLSQWSDWLKSHDLMWPGGLVRVMYDHCATIWLVTQGDWVDDDRCGEGEFTYNTGDTYRGNWADNKQSMVHLPSTENLWQMWWWFVSSCTDGFGELQYASNDIYRGYWKDGVRHGDVRLPVCLSHLSMCLWFSLLPTLLTSLSFSTFLLPSLFPFFSLPPFFLLITLPSLSPFFPSLSPKLFRVESCTQMVTTLQATL